MRAKASDRSEMINQLLEGDTFDVIERRKKWSFVRCNYDAYCGWVDNKQYVHFDSAVDLAMRLFLDTPYLWGGRSTGGIDCSGLVQVCFKAMGVWLPRDATQQIIVGDEICLRDVRCDDLAFFQNDEGGIVHVGICMGDGHIIHASGCVRVDMLDSKGILDEKEGVYTHRLHSIRRVR